MDLAFIFGLSIGGYFLMKKYLQTNLFAGDKNIDFEKISHPDPDDVSLNLKISKYDLTPLYKKHARANNIDWMLLRAVAMTESSENPAAVNRADPSYGLMQILYRLDASGQPNKFNVDDWPPLMTGQLFDPDYSLHIGAQILAWNLQTYGYPKGIAVYNNWSARTAEINGPFSNQEYVDTVLAYYKQIRLENGIYAA